MVVKMTVVFFCGVTRPRVYEGLISDCTCWRRREYGWLCNWRRGGAVFRWVRFQGLDTKNCNQSIYSNVTDFIFQFLAVSSFVLVASSLGRPWSVPRSCRALWRKNFTRLERAVNRRVRTQPPLSKSVNHATRPCHTSAFYCRLPIRVNLFSIYIGRLFRFCPWFYKKIRIVLRKVWHNCWVRWPGKF